MRDISELATVEGLHDAAAADYVAACASYESAIESGDSARTVAAQQRLHATGDEYARTLADLVSARRSAAPSFEQLLRDPIIQVDGESAILASIIAYAAAKPATAGMEVSVRAAFVGLVGPLSTGPEMAWLGLDRSLRDTADALTATR